MVATNSHPENHPPRRKTATAIALPSPRSHQTKQGVQVRVGSKGEIPPPAPYKVLPTSSHHLYK